MGSTILFCKEPKLILEKVFFHQNATGQLGLGQKKILLYHHHCTPFSSGGKRYNFVDLSGPWKAFMGKVNIDSAILHFGISLWHKPFQIEDTQSSRGIHIWFEMKGLCCRQGSLAVALKLHIVLKANLFLQTLAKVRW